MKRLLVLAAAAAMLSVAAPAAAQDADRLIPVVAAPQDAEREAKEALVRRFFVAAQLDKLTNVLIEQMLQSTQSPQIPADKREVVNEAIMAAYAEVSPRMNEAFVDLYADAFTLDELEQLVAFYESPVGRSVTAKSVVLTRQLGSLMEEFQPMMAEATTRQVCRRIDCSAAGVAPSAKR